MPVATNIHDPQQAIGESEEFLRLQERISAAAATQRPVIFIGERGTGKELAARRLHLLSARWNQAYLTLNCGSLAPTLIESELFGHEAGAFTGATRLRKGRFEMAHEGSLFLDEIANIPMTAQEKILRVVEYGPLERVGSSNSMEVDVRLICATNVDLRAMARRGEFRQDLLDRLSFEVIVLPPLRARLEDILPLASHFARKMTAELGREEPPEFSAEAEQQLLKHEWPGNVRELKNVVERMVYRTSGARIERIVFDPFESEYMPTDAPEISTAEPVEQAARDSGASKAAINGDDAPDADPNGDAREAEFWKELCASNLPEAVRALELRRLCEALTEARFNQRRAAEMLGLTYHQFRGYYRKYRKELAERS